MHAHPWKLRHRGGLQPSSNGESSHVLSRAVTWPNMVSRRARWEVQSPWRATGPSFIQTRSDTYTRLPNTALLVTSNDYRGPSLGPGLTTTAELRCGPSRSCWEGRGHSASRGNLGDVLRKPGVQVPLCRFPGRKLATGGGCLWDGDSCFC